MYLRKNNTEGKHRTEVEDRERERDGRREGK